MAGVRPSYEMADTAADDPAQLYYSSGTTGKAKGILHAHRYLLAHEEFEFCHDVQRRRAVPRLRRVGVGRRHLPAARPVALRRRAVRLRAQGRLRPRGAAALALEARGAEHVHDADRAARDDRAWRTPASATRCKLRITCSAGEPLNPEVIRWFREQFGITVLDYYGLTESYPLCGNFPTVEVREGSMGLPMPGWEVAILDEDEKPLPPGERGEICLQRALEPALPDRLLEPPRGHRGGLRRRLVPHQGRRAARRGRLLLVRRARRRRDHLGRLPDRAVRGRVGVRRAPGGHGGGGGRVTRPERAATSSRRSSCSAEGHEPTDELADEIKALRPRAPLGVRVPARDRVRGRPAEDADRQDPPHRAARGGAGEEAGRRSDLSNRVATVGGACGVRFSGIDIAVDPGHGRTGRREARSLRPPVHPQIVENDDDRQREHSGC